MISTLDPTWFHCIKGKSKLGFSGCNIRHFILNSAVMYFFAVHFLSATNGNLTVLQSSRLSLTKGETATIQCSWKGRLNRHRVNWLKNGTKIGGDVKRTKISTQGNLSVLVIHNVSSEDSGLYVCNVIQEVPNLRWYIGAGTQLTVNSETNRKCH